MARPDPADRRRGDVGVQVHQDRDNKHKPQHADDAGTVTLIGIGGIMQMNAQLVSQTQIEGWSLIQQGVDLNDPQKIADGNELLLLHEQQVTAQAAYDQPEVHTLLAFLSDHPALRTTLQSPIPDDPSTFRDVVQTGHNGGPPNLADFEDRWQWIDSPGNGMLARWQNWSQQHNNIALEDLGVNMSEEQLVVKIKGDLLDLWNAAAAFPDLLAWQPRGN